MIENHVWPRNTLWIKFVSRCENSRRGMPHSTFHDKSPLIHMVAWCGQSQAISFVNVDRYQRCHKASLRQNELRKVTF